MKESNIKISTTWQKAIVIGSYWAANEIVLGSFLHNLRIPLSGTIMAFLSVIILVSFSVYWQEKGIIWRAGLIAALMKSISPSAIILGPMIGISLEAFIVYLIIAALGRNLFSYIIAGGIAVSMVLFQKLGRLLIIYGFDFITIIKNFISYATSSLQIDGLSPKEIAIALVGIYFVAGLFAGIIGFYVGKKAVLLKGKTSDFLNLVPLKDKIFNKTEKSKYSLTLLALNLGGIIFGMYLLNISNIYFGIIFTFFYISFVVYRYRNSLNRLKKIKFWIWFVLITLASSYFLSDTSSDITEFRLEGLKQGLLLNLRAAMVVLGFVAISTELKNPLIKSLIYKRGASSLYESLEIAFGVLPQIINSIPKTKEFIKKPLVIISSFVGVSDMILNQIVMKNFNGSRVIILSGEIQQGKTSLLSGLIEKDILKKLKIRGFLSKVKIENDERRGYNLQSISTDEQLNLCSIEAHIDRLKYGRFYFDKKAFALGCKIIDESKLENTDLLIIDEIGPLEMSGEGWANSVEKAIDRKLPMIWVVRKHLLQKAVRKWNIDCVYIIDLTESEDYENKLLESVLKITGN